MKHLFQSMESYEVVHKGMDEQDKAEDLSLGLTKDNHEEDLENYSDCEVLKSKRKIDDDQDIKVGEDNDHENGDKQSFKRSNKRSKKQETTPSYLFSEIFLRIVYPLSLCANKNVTVGFCKFLNYTPGVILSHGNKQITLIEEAWKSFNRIIPLIHCYLINNVYGKKTSISVECSDIEVVNIKMRGDLFVRIRNLSSHDDKVLLNRNELEILINAVPAVDRYMQQLEMSRSVIKDFLINSIENGLDYPLFTSTIDNSIHNRLPQEIYLYRCLKSLQPPEIRQEEQLCTLLDGDDEPLIKYEYEEPLDLSKASGS
jgi:hypothetical protein